MPYAVVTQGDRAARLALANARWTAMLAAKPDLAPAISLQRRLIALVLDLSAAFEGTHRPRLSLPPRYVTTKLRSGIPALTGEPIQVPVDALAPTLLGLVAALAEGGGGEATRLIRVALEEGTANPGALLTLALRREQAALRAFATKAGLGHDLLWLVCDLATGPFANALLPSVFGDAAGPLRDALDGWARGYCPLCGSWPGYTEHHGDTRRLRCSFCAATWDLPFGSCIYCGKGGETLGTIAPNPGRPHRALETCTGCKGYSKVVDEELSLPFPLLPLADLDSMDLDIMAMQRGFARPAVKQFARR
ncbi:MAG: formate dehydrogenase accessory protein FdhE [Vicinamibacterales bacterium]